jgi:protein phosphatase
MSGKQNEDRYGVTAFDAAGQPQVLAVLCDGIGGHRAGEVAAEMGVSLITDVVGASEGDQPLATLSDAIVKAGRAIYEASRSDHGRAGMGATCACDQLYTANLGDSRIYLLRQGDLIQLSTDHTWIQEAIDAGIISSEEGEDHPNAHIIRRYLGSKAPAEPDFRLWFFEGEDDAAARANQGLKLEPKDLILICSDGLTDLVSDDEIRDVLVHKKLSKAPGKLIAMANERGGHDNITVILMRAPRRMGRVKGSRKRRWAIGCLAALAVVSFVVALVWVGLRLRSDWQEATVTPTVTATEQVSDPTLTGVPGEPALAPTPTATLQAPEPTTEPEGYQPSITPWPTDTQSP